MTENTQDVDALVAALATLRLGGDVCGPCDLGAVCVTTHEPHPDCPIEAAFSTLETLLADLARKAVPENTQEGYDYRRAIRLIIGGTDGTYDERAAEADRLAAYIDQHAAALSTANEQVKVLEAKRDARDLWDGYLRDLLREACEEFGDNDWPDDLAMYDVVDKHLLRYLYSAQVNDEAVKDA